MKKISIYSVVIGVGIGIIISSIFNIIWIQLEYIYLQGKDSSFQQDSTSYTNINDEIKYRNDDRLISLENDSNLNAGKNMDANTINKEYNEIFISKGMLSEEIANLLQEKGIIESVEEFNSLASKLQITVKFQSGLKTIPNDSSLDEIMLILTK